jgi:hypothetical protein
VLHIHDHLKGGGLVNESNTADLFEGDQRTIQLDISAIRCYMANGLALHGNCDKTIVYNRSKGGCMMKKFS